MVCILIFLSFTLKISMCPHQRVDLERRLTDWFTRELKVRSSGKNQWRLNSSEYYCGHTLTSQFPTPMTNFLPHTRRIHGRTYCEQIATLYPGNPHQCTHFKAQWDSWHFTRETQSGALMLYRLPTITRSTHIGVFILNRHPISYQIYP